MPTIHWTNQSSQQIHNYYNKLVRDLKYEKMCNKNGVEKLLVLVLVEPCFYEQQRVAETVHINTLGFIIWDF